MGKLLLIAATCLLAMSIGTLLAEGAKHKKHQKKSAAHLKGKKANQEGPTGEELYNDATAFVDAAEKCLQSFNTKGSHVAAAGAVATAHAKLEKVIKELMTSHSKHPKPPKEGEFSITQQFELGEGESHSFDTHNLSQKTLKALEKEAKAVSGEANNLKGKKTLKGHEKTKFQGDVTKLIHEVEQMEGELGISTPLEGQGEGEFDFFDGDDEE